MLRLFLLHPKNPDRTTGPLTRYSPGETLTLLHKVPLGAIEVINLPGLNRIHAWCCRWMFRDNFPSLFGFFCRRGPIAFVIGPIKQSNGFQKFDLQKSLYPVYPQRTVGLESSATSRFEDHVSELAQKSVA